MTVYELTTPVTFYRPARWQPHLRYALLLPGRDITLSAGTWLLALSPEIGTDERLYRLAGGLVVASGTGFDLFLDMIYLRLVMIHS